MEEHLKFVVKEILTLLVEKKYKEIEALTRGIRLNADEIAYAIKDYGRQLTLPPDEGFQFMSVIKIKNAKPECWSIAMPLWTKEEGRSDLTLEMTVIGQKDSFSMELDDLHVL